MSKTLQELIDARAARLAEQKYNATLRSRSVTATIIQALPTHNDPKYFASQAAKLTQRLRDPNFDLIPGATSRAKERIRLLRSFAKHAP